MALLGVWEGVAALGADVGVVTVEVFVIGFVHEVYKGTVVGEGLVLDGEAAFTSQEEHFGLVEVEEEVFE